MWPPRRLSVVFGDMAVARPGALMSSPLSSLWPHLPASLWKNVRASDLTPAWNSSVYRFVPAPQQDRHEISDPDGLTNILACHRHQQKTFAAAAQHFLRDRLSKAVP